jgi:hypothetical protein
VTDFASLAGSPIQGSAVDAAFARLDGDGSSVSVLPTGGNRSRITLANFLASQGAPLGFASLDSAANVVNAPLPSGGDDYPALVAAGLNLLDNGGGDLLLGCGNYSLSQPFVLPNQRPGVSRVKLRGQGMNTTTFSPLAPMTTLIEADAGFTSIFDIGFVNVNNWAQRAITVSADNNGYPIDIAKNSFVSFGAAIVVNYVDNMYIRDNFFNANQLGVKFTCAGGFVLGPIVEGNFVLGGCGFDFPIPPTDNTSPNGSYHCEGAFIAFNTVLVSASATTPADAQSPYSLRVMSGLDITSRDNTYGQNILGGGILVDGLSGAATPGVSITHFSSIDDWIDGAVNTGVVRHGLSIVGAVSFSSIKGLKVNSINGYGIALEGTSSAPVAGTLIHDMRTFGNGTAVNTLGDIFAGNAINTILSDSQLNHPTSTVTEAGSTITIATGNVFAHPPSFVVASKYSAAANIGL